MPKTEEFFFTWIVVKTKEKGGSTRPEPIVSEGKVLSEKWAATPSGTDQPFWFGYGCGAAGGEATGSWNRDNWIQ